MDLDIAERAEVDLDVRQCGGGFVFCELLFRSQVEFPMKKVNRLRIVGPKWGASRSCFRQAGYHQHKPEPRVSSIGTQWTTLPHNL
jgi:hypothetical protein